MPVQGWAPSSREDIHAFIYEDIKSFLKLLCEIDVFLGYEFLVMNFDRVIRACTIRFHRCYRPMPFVDRMVLSVRFRRSLRGQSAARRMSQMVGVMGRLPVIA